MANLSNPTRQISVTKFGGQFTEADARDLPMGASPLCHDCDFDVAGVTIRPGLSLPVTFSPTPSGSNFLFVKSVYLQAGIAATLAHSSEGKIWHEDLSSEGSFGVLYGGILNNSRAIIENIADRGYVCLSDLSQGTDQPRQYDGTNFDRISQVGPGAGPTVAAPDQQQAESYPIDSIIEAWPQRTIFRAIWGANADPSGSQVGQLLTLQGAAADTTFTAGLNIGDYIYIAGLPLLDNLNVNGTYQVTFVGTWDFGSGTQQIVQVQTYNTSPAGILSGYPLSGATYQKTEAIVQLGVPIPPNLAQVGSNIVVTGVSPTQWNANWQVLSTPTEGQLAISSTSLTSNVATYDYSVTSGFGPGWQASTLVEIGTQIVDGSGNVYQVDQPGTTGGTEPTFGGATVTDNTVVWAKQSLAKVLVTVFNTNNGNGIFNVQGATITSATPTTFTIALTSANVTSAAEQGQAYSGQGTEFVIDPGILAVSTGSPGTNPIYGNSTVLQGYVLVQNPDIAAGQRYAVSLFLTRNGYLTPASPPVSFYTTQSTASITFDNLAIGPVDVIARIVAITAANAGIGGPYFWIPADKVLPASAQTFGQTITYNKTIVDDNTSTSLGPINLSDSVLTASNNITLDGNNRLRVRELGECVKAIPYAGRAFYLGERTKVDNFVNLTFDGGTVAGAAAGWTLEAGTAPTISPSTIFGGSAVFGASSGTIQQTAYQDAYSVSIIQPSTAYSVRITALGTGTLTVELYDGTNTYSVSPTLTSSFQEFILPFNNPKWEPVPSTLVLRVIGQNCTVDRMEVFPTDYPVYVGQIAVSYTEDTESIDSQTGQIDISAFTSEPATNIFRFLDVLYITTATRTLSVPANSAGEPDTWDIREVSNAEGCVGPMCEDVGEEYVLVADLRGVYVFDGGNHIKLSQGIQQLWDSIYWNSGKTIWVRNDLHNQRILVGIPIPTPNVWIPDAPTNATPSLPNWVEEMSYLGVISGRAMGEEVDVHPSMFTGQLLWVDMRRKWNPWQIAAPFGNWIIRANGSEELWLCGSTASSVATIYELDSTVLTDDGASIPQFYMTYGFSDRMSEEQLALGAVRKLYPYASVLIEGAGNFYLDVYPETPSTSYIDTQPKFALANPALDDTNIPLNTTGNRAFLAFRVDGTAGSYFRLRRIVLGAQPDPHIPVSGR